MNVFRSRLLDILSIQFLMNKKLKEKYVNSKWLLRNLFCWRIFLNISKIAEKCSTSNVIKEQLNWRIMYVNLGAKVVVFPWGNWRHFCPLSSWPTGKPTSTPSAWRSRGGGGRGGVGWGGVGTELPHANDSRCSSSRLDGRDCRFLSHLPLFRTENQYSFYPQWRFCS